MPTALLQEQPTRECSTGSFPVTVQQMLSADPAISLAERLLASASRPFYLAYRSAFWCQITDDGTRLYSWWAETSHILYFLSTRKWNMPLILTRGESQIIIEDEAGWVG